MKTFILTLGMSTGNTGQLTVSIHNSNLKKRAETPHDSERCYRYSSLPFSAHQSLYDTRLSLVNIKRSGSSES